MKVWWKVKNLWRRSASAPPASRRFGEYTLLLNFYLRRSQQVNKSTFSFCQSSNNYHKEPNIHCNLIKCCQVWSSGARCDQLLPGVTCCQVWPDVASCNHLLPAVARYDQMFLGLTSCCQVWPDVSRSEQLLPAVTITKQILQQENNHLNHD